MKNDKNKEMNVAFNEALDRVNCNNTNLTTRKCTFSVSDLENVRGVMCWIK